MKSSVREIVLHFPIRDLLRFKGGTIPCEMKLVKYPHRRLIYNEIFRFKLKLNQLTFFFGNSL